MLLYSHVTTFGLILLKKKDNYGLDICSVVTNEAMFPVIELVNFYTKGRCCNMFRIS